MKRHFLAIAALIPPLLTSLHAAAPETTIPVPSYLKKFMPSRHLEKLEEAKSGSFEWVMLGDSITHNWEKDYAQTIGQYSVLNLGFAGDRTQNVLWRLQNGAVDGLSPKLITLLIGTNNVHGDKHYDPYPPEEIFQGIEKIVSELRSRLPESQIVVFSIFPRKEGPENDRAMAVNKLLPALANDKNVTHIDLNKTFLDEQGRLNQELYSNDGLHLNAEGYVQWFAALLPILENAGLTKTSPQKSAVSDSKPQEAAIDPASTIWFKNPAKGFDQSLVLGNGRVGAMIYGDPEKESIVLNEESCWSGSPAENNVPGGHKHLPEIRRLLGEEKYTEANALLKQAFKVTNTPAYGEKISAFGRFQNLGKLHLNFKGAKEPVTEYSRVLDLSTGLATVRYKRGGETFVREHFVSAPDEVIVTRITGPVSFTVEMDRKERFKTETVGDRELLLSGHLNDGFDNDGVQYVARLRVAGGKVKAEGNKLVVTSDGEVLLLVAAATDYRGIAGRQLSDPLAATTADLDKVANKSFAELRAAQKEDHEKFYKRVSLSLPQTENSTLPTDQRLANYRNGAEDPALAALFFNTGRYLLISSSRPGGLPANLQGIWAEEIHTMWNGDYHFNINTQMNYWPALPCNLVELQEPLNTFIASLVEPGSKTAKAYYNSPGWIAHRMTNVWGYTAPAGMDIGGAAWLCEHLWEQYAFTLDKDYLAQVYPVMKSSVEFYLDNLYEEPENKWLVTGPSASPENGFMLADGETGSGICAGPTIDLQQLRELFANTSQAAKILGVDEDLQKELLEKRPRIAPNQIAPDGVLQEWLKPYKEREPGHRHVSPLYGLYPYYEITPEGTPELAEASRKLLERRGVSQSTGWSNAWKVNLWARLGDATKAWGFVDQMLKDNCFDNMLSLFRPLIGGKGKKLFQIEANFGLTSGIAEMLLQSQPESGAIGAEPVLRLLPALPKAWPSGKVTGLRARGGVEVDLEWKDGELVDARLRSSKDQRCNVRYGAQTKNVDLKAGELTKVF